jgi:Sec-independent protein translocase protein TatA
MGEGASDLFERKEEEAGTFRKFKKAAEQMQNTPESEDGEEFSEPMRAVDASGEVGIDDEGNVHLPRAA